VPSHQIYRSATLVLPFLAIVSGLGYAAIVSTKVDESPSSRRPSTAKYLARPEMPPPASISAPFGSPRSPAREGGLFALEWQEQPIKKDNGGAGQGPNGKIPIVPVGEQQSAPLLHLLRSNVLLVNMIPAWLSDETQQNSEPFLAVHPDQRLMVGSAYFFGDHTPVDVLPLFVSSDGGLTWDLKALLPYAEISNQTYCFSGAGKKLYGVVLVNAKVGAGVLVLDAVVLETENPQLSVNYLVVGSARFVLEMMPPAGKLLVATSAFLGIGGLMSPVSQLRPEKPPDSGVDRPYIQARAFGSADRIYVGENYFGLAPRTAAIRASLDSGKTFRLLGLEARDTTGQNGPAVIPTIANDGTVYAAFYGWRAQEGSFVDNTLLVTSDIVLVRDDEGAAGPTPFCALADPSDGKPGRIVASNRAVPFSNKGLGQERVGGSLALAVDPNDSGRVYLAWGDRVDGVYTLHLRKSGDRGLHWSEDLLTVPSAINPAIAIADNGTVGFLYQQLANSGTPEESWETHLRNGSDMAWGDLVFTSFPTAIEPKAQFLPYLGGYINLLAVGDSFCGVFCAPNNPDWEYFPQGVIFQRKHRIGQLLSRDGKTPVSTSIDPYFFRVPARPHMTAERADLILNNYLERAVLSELYSSNPVLTSATILLTLAGLVGLVAILSARRVAARALEARSRGPELVNYQGFVAAAFTVSGGMPVSESGPRKRLSLEVRFCKEKPDDFSVEQIEIQGGRNQAKVSFRISIDSGDFQVIPEENHLEFEVRETGQAVFKVVAPPTPGKHRLFVQVFQNAQLVQVVAPLLTVRETSRG
jgi:hypothetical protein